MLALCFGALVLGVTGLDNGAAPTPPMGFQSYMAPPELHDEKGLEKVADFFISSGLKDLGFVYVNTDEGWELKDRDPKTGRIQWDPSRYPSGITNFTARLHAKGIKFGLYGAASGVTCGVMPGGLYNEDVDAQTYADWGVDFFKSDNCATYALDPSVRFRSMMEALNRTGRKMLFSIEPFSITPDASLSSEVSNMWRIGDDIRGKYVTLMDRADISDKWSPLAGPNSWNDPDMIQLQNPPSAGSDEGLTLGENRLYFGLWAIMKAPLLVSGDIVNLIDDIAKGIVGNPEVIAVNQDSLSVQARKVAVNGSRMPWLVGIEDCTSPPGTAAYFARTGGGRRGRVDTRQWKMSPVDGQKDTFTMLNEATGRCLAVLDNAGAWTRTSVVVLLPCDASSPAFWWLFDKGPNTVTSITNRQTGSALAVSNTTVYAAVHKADAVPVSDAAYGVGPLVLVEPYDQPNCTSRSCENYDPSQMWYSSADGFVRHALYTASLNHKKDGEGYVLTPKVPTYRRNCLAHVLSVGNFGSEIGTTEVWGGPLSGGDFVFALVNRDTSPAKIEASIDWITEAWPAQNGGTYTVRDLWKRTDVGKAAAGGAFSATIDGHDVGLFRLVAKKA